MLITRVLHVMSCCCYHKGTYFQANHNRVEWWDNEDFVVVATTKVRIFKQITTACVMTYLCRRCCCYHKGTYFQANHNTLLLSCLLSNVVVATTKVRIFKQITTEKILEATEPQLLLLPQRYVFSSKSQRGR